MTSQEQRLTLIRDRLSAGLTPQRLEIDDDGRKHIGHTGARGGGHFTVRIVAQAFAAKTLLERHRMIYDLLGDMMHGEIHALSIQALSPDEL